MGRDHHVRPIPGGGVAHAGQDAGRLAAMLCAGAAGWHADQAAAELLLRHGYWPGQGEFVRRFVRAGAGAAPAAWVDWQGAVDGLDGGGLAGTGSEGAVLRFAASLGGGLPVSLRAVLGGLDHVNIGLVAEALLRANGTTAATVSVPAPAARPPGVRVAGRGEGRSGQC